jgi:predicted ATPase
MAAYDATGAAMSKPAHLLLLAKVYGQAQQAEEALGALASARAAMEQTGERTYEAEMHRLEGALTLDSARRTARRRQVAAGAMATAEVCFRRALEAARHQRAKSLELRAAIDLSRLWQRQGKRQEARQLLGEIYGSFTEGYDTPDLRDARALLAELA